MGAYMHGSPLATQIQSCLKGQLSSQRSIGDSSLCPTHPHGSPVIDSLLSPLPMINWQLMISRSCPGQLSLSCGGGREEENCSSHHHHLQQCYYQKFSSYQGPCNGNGNSSTLNTYPFQARDDIREFLPTLEESRTVQVMIGSVSEGAV